MLQYSPKIVTDGLVMCLDPSQNKSYPTTDLPVKSGLVMWMDAADDTTFSYSSGTTVSQWRDKSGFNYHMVPKSSGPTRSVSLNSRKALAFTTSQTIGNDTINLSSSPNTVFVVTRLTGATNGRVLTCNLDSGGNNWLLGHHGGTSNAYYAEGWVYDSGGASTSFQIYMGDWSGSSTDLANFYINGTAYATNSTAASQGPNKLGINYYSIQTSACEAAEIIVFNRILTAVERRLINTYLGQKWGISNTDRQIFDLSGNNFNFLFNGTNPRYNSKSFVSNFNTASPYAVSSFGGQNLTSNILNLLYSDHTIEVAFNPKGFQSVYNYDNSLTTQNAQGIIVWTGQHSGLRVYQNTIIYEYWNSQSSTVGISVSISSYQDKIIYITATRTGDTLRIYINGVLASGPTTVAATTSPVSYSQINIGAAYQGNPTTQGYVWASQHEYHLLRMYNRQLNASEVSSNYQSFKARFDNNIVRFGLVLDLDAGNPYSYAGAGTTWYDVSGNAINASAYLTSYYSTSYGGVLNFPGNSSYYNTSTVSTFNLGASSFSMEAWVYLDAGTSSDNAYRGIISLGTNSSNYVYISKWRSGLYSGLYAQYIAGGATITGVYQANEYNPVSRWSHVVATKSSNVLSFYVNGSLVYSVNDLNTTFTGNSSVFVAQAHAGVNSLNGNIGESRVYNIALSAAQVLQNYNATKGRFGL